MTRSKKPNEALDALLDAESKDSKITKPELSEEELKSVSGGKHISNFMWTGGKASVPPPDIIDRAVAWIKGLLS